MNEISEVQIGCPYCGERNRVLIDRSIEQQQYIEDCQVCCRPIVLTAHSHPDEPSRVEVRREDDC